jgi:hypothetical protein
MLRLRMSGAIPLPLLPPVYLHGMDRYNFIFIMVSYPRKLEF